ncbi:MAG TPA: type II toxin-antitoxin system VapB family antitoxin [Thermoanaerobaculia bacterium]|nr:type II toxin-antitoxin system VapB family antitoxin [Thermoanaerobaculia bacterium]
MHAKIEIDDELIESARQVTGLMTERAIIEAAIRLLVQLKTQGRLRELRGKVAWEGDLDESRRSRFLGDQG